MTLPRCTVVIPVYQDVSHLGEALTSLTGQTIQDWEAVVVDDGSTPEASVSDIVAGLSDPRIRLIRHPHNRGLAAARNSGIRAASNPNIVTLDSDDYLDPKYLETVMPFLADKLPFNCVYTDTQMFGASDHRVTRQHTDVLTLLRWQWIPATGVAIRRSLWADVGGFWEDRALRVGNEDREFWIASIGHGLYPHHIPEPLLFYRTGHVSMSSRLSLEEWRTRIAIVERHRDLFRRERAGGAFLADGYLMSAEAWRTQGHRLRAVTLALRALKHQLRGREVLGILGRAMLPSAIHDTLRTIRSRLEHR